MKGVSWPVSWPLVSGAEIITDVQQIQHILACTEWRIHIFPVLLSYSNMRKGRIRKDSSFDVVSNCLIFSKSDLSCPTKTYSRQELIALEPIDGYLTRHHSTSTYAPK